MPIYEYYCNYCMKLSEENISIDKRDNAVKCTCGNYKYRKISFNGTVWSPTANGGMK